MRLSRLLLNNTGNLKFYSNKIGYLEAMYKYSDNSYGKINKIFMQNSSLIGDWKDKNGEGKIIFQNIKYNELKAWKLIYKQKPEIWHCIMLNIDDYDKSYSIVK